MVVPLPVEPMTALAAILFGKLPHHGDFVARGLDPRSREAVDGWLSASVAQSLEALSHTFAAAHDAAPVWRFVARDGGWGAGWKAGALAPSVDRAGRRFFILLAVSGLSDADAGARGRLLAAAMEQLIYDAFSQGWDADGLHRAAALAAQAIGGAGAPTLEPTEIWWVADADGRPALERTSRPEALIQSLESMGVTESIG